MVEALSPQQAAREFAAKPLSEGYVPDGLHEYTDQTGKVIYWRIRLKHPDGRKWIRPMYQDDVGQFRVGEPPHLKDAPKLLYGLHLLAQNPAATAWIMEGEKKTDIANQTFEHCDMSNKYIATTSGSATSDGGADWTVLAGRHCIIFPDNDNGGLGYADRVAEKLRALGCTVEIIDVAALALPEGGDFVDWLAANQTATANDLLALPRMATAHDWPDPQPIQAPLRPVMAFDPDTLLPEVLQAWVKDSADRMPCPLDFVAAAAVVALGSVIGARCAIKPKSKDDWLVVPNLWGGVVGSPSAKKSPAITAALKPLDRLVALALEAHKAAEGDFETQSIIHDAQEEALTGRLKSAAKKSTGGTKDEK